MISRHDALASRYNGQRAQVVWNGQCDDFLPLRNRGLGALAVTVCPFRFPEGPPLPVARAHVRTTRDIPPTFQMGTARQTRWSALAPSVNGLMQTRAGGDRDGNLDGVGEERRTVIPFRDCTTLPDALITPTTCVDGPHLARDHLACSAEVACSHVSGLLVQSGWTAGPDGVREPSPHHSNGIDVPMKRQVWLGCVGSTDVPSRVIALSQAPERGSAA
jgi:hypothetical protein